MTSTTTSAPAVLVLADGTVFDGLACGSRGTVVGEVVFNTGMTGYQEVLTDPSYSGQLVTFTYPELGNTGVNPEDQEADRPHARGLIARQLAPLPSNWRCQQTLDTWLEAHGVVGIQGIDTRALVRHLRDSGAMNGVISSDGRSPQELFRELQTAPSMQGLNLADKVSTTEPYTWSKPCAAPFDQRIQPRPERPYKVVAIDFGIKRAILDRLVGHGCEVTVLPASSSLETVLAHQPEGVFLSNGPGDPSAVTGGIALAKDLVWPIRPCHCSASALVIRSLVLPWAVQPSNLISAIAVSITRAEQQVRLRSPARTTGSPSTPPPSQMPWRSPISI